MSQVAVCFFKVAVVGMTALIASSQVLAQTRAEVLERIAPVGKVQVEGREISAQPAAVAEAKPMAENQPAPAPAAEPAAMVKEEQAPAAQPEPTPAAVAQPANDGAGLFVAKACSSCHGADANSPIMPIYPRLAGQNAQYLAQQMKDIKSGARNHGQTMLMKGIMAGVSEDEIKTIADWLSTL